MSHHTIDDLRRRLFEAIDGVTGGTLDLDQARQISDLAQVIVNTAKVEVDFLRATDGGDSPFLRPRSGPPRIASTDPVNNAVRGRLGRD